jgi:hypothetical protein
MSIQSTSVSSNFFEISKDIARDFLQTVVIIDDQATFEEPKPELIIEEPKGRGRRETLFLEDQQTKGDVAESEASEVLNVKPLNDCFADSGLVCCVLKPTKQETSSIVTKANHVARRADIVIFDWKLNSEETPGATALKCICAILNDDVVKEKGSFKSQPRTRLIAVYTSMLELDEIIDKTQKFLEKKGLHFTKKKSFTLVLERVKIVFYRKDRGTGVIDEIKERTVYSVPRKSDR